MQSEAIRLREGELDRTRARIQDLQSELIIAYGRRDALTMRLEQAERMVSESATRLREISDALQGHQAQLVELRARQQTVNLELEGEQRALSEQIRASYKLGYSQRLRLLLSQNEPAVMSRVMAYFDYLNRARARRLRAVRQGLDELAMLEGRVVEEIDARHRARQRQALELEQLEEARQARANALGEVQSRIVSEEQRLAQLRTNERQLEAMIGDLHRALREIAQQEQILPFDQQAGRLSWPVKGKVVSSFGDPRPDTGLRWRGLLIKAPAGQEIKAIHPGRVVFADWMPGFGMLTIIDHGNSYLSVYAHAQANYTQAGDQVRAGDVVAEVGSSGGLEFDGLYFEVRHEGQPLDPRQWLSGA